MQTIWVYKSEMLTAVAGDMGSNDFITLFFLVAAVLIFLQLRSVLGRRTGNEKPPAISIRRAMPPIPEADAGKVVTLAAPRRRRRGKDRFAAIDAFTKAGTPLNDALREDDQGRSLLQPEGIRQWRQAWPTR
jgi:predicted lipid-binding transport protein (Tim44 family)